MRSLTVSSVGRLLLLAGRLLSESISDVRLVPSPAQVRTRDRHTMAGYGGGGQQPLSEAALVWQLCSAFDVVFGLLESQAMHDDIVFPGLAAGWQVRVCSTTLLMLKD